MNGLEVGRGVGPNKKQAKLIASQVALSNICPSLYNEWKAKNQKIKQILNPQVEQAAQIKE